MSPLGTRSRGQCPIVEMHLSQFEILSLHPCPICFASQRRCCTGCLLFLIEAESDNLCLK